MFPAPLSLLGEKNTADELLHAADLTVPTQKIDPKSKDFQFSRVRLVDFIRQYATQHPKEKKTVIILNMYPEQLRIHHRLVPMMCIFALVSVG